MQNGSRELWRARLYEMKRDWLVFIAEADVRGDLEEATLYRTQIARIAAMLDDIGADPDLNPPRRAHA